MEKADEILRHGVGAKRGAARLEKEVESFQPGLGMQSDARFAPPPEPFNPTP
jgi:hypothetical protein